jgi:hypothetical protein
MFECWLQVAEHDFRLPLTDVEMRWEDAAISLRFTSDPITVVLHKVYPIYIYINGQPRYRHIVQDSGVTEIRDGTLTVFITEKVDYNKNWCVPLSWCQR